MTLIYDNSIYPSFIPSTGRIGYDYISNATIKQYNIADIDNTNSTKINLWSNHRKRDWSSNIFILLLEIASENNIHALIDDIINLEYRGNIVSDSLPSIYQYKSVINL